VSRNSAKREVTVKAPNSLILVGDPDGQPPVSMADKLVAATTSCVAVGTLSQPDGATRLRLFGATDDLPERLAFEGLLQTPNRLVAVRNVLGETYLEKHVSAAVTSVQIWVNDLSEPDDICVLAT
jgi:hypothetical protein